MTRDEARTLAQQFAAHLRHLREFRGQAYVGAARSPARASEATWPSGQVEADPAKTWPSGQIERDPGDTSPRPVATQPVRTWPSGQVERNPGEASPRPVETTRPASAAPSTPSRSARPDLAAASGARDPGSARAEEIVPANIARATWPSRQVARAGAHAEAPPAPADRAAAGSATPVRLPLAPTADDPRTAEPGVRGQARTWTAAEKLEYLRRKNIGNCQRCKLAASRTQIVFGVGDPEAEVMFIGEAPGFDEDRQGEPFVGAAGRRLTQWLGRLGLGREQVYIANVLKCRPPGNRDPEPDEVERCSPFLRAQIRAIAPKLIIALGRHAGMLLLGGPQDRTLREMRARSWTYEDPSGAHRAALHVTYHPSYVIRRERELPPGQRNPADDTVMADLQQALQKLSTTS